MTGAAHDHPLPDALFADRDNDISGCLARFNRFVSRYYLIELESLRHVMDNLTTRKHRGQLGARAFAHLLAHLVDQKELQCDAVLEQKLERDRQLRRTAALDDNCPVRRQHVRQELGIGSEIDLDHCLDAASPCDLPDALPHALAPVVDHVVRPGLARDVGFAGGAHRGDHKGASLFGELNGIVTYRARAAGDQHCGALLGAGEIDRLPRGIGRDAETSGGLHAYIRRQRNRLLGRNYDRLGGCAERTLPLAVPQPDALAHPRRRNAFSHAINLARAVAVRDYAWKCRLARSPRTALDVRRIDSGRAQPDADFAACRLRSFDIANLQHLTGSAISLIVGSTHHDLVLI